MIGPMSKTEMLLFIFIVLTKRDKKEEEDKYKQIQWSLVLIE